MKKVIVFVFGFFLIGISQATIIYVPSDVPTIQAGIDIAAHGDTVLVDVGTYVENINFNGKNIVVGSLTLTTGDTSYISQTVIDGDSSGSVVTFENGEGSSTGLRGFTIRNGYIIGGIGGGISCSNNSNPTLRDLVVTNNGAGPGAFADVPGFGGGIGCIESSPALFNVKITENIVSSSFGDAKGGGVCFFSSSSVLRNVTISNNQSYNYGGGIYCSDSDINIDYCTITSNSAGYGGGIVFATTLVFSGSGSHFPILTNTTISGNSASYGGGIFCTNYAQPKLVNTIIWNDLPEEIYFDAFGYWPSTITIAYSDVKGGEAGIMTNDNDTVYWEEGNIDADPLFVDAENGDYYLQEDSPCIDAGTAFLVWVGDTLVNLSPDEYVGIAPDIGAFESPYTAAIDEGNILPNRYALHQNYPNPFNPTTTIEFSIPVSELVKLTVYDILGREVETILNQHINVGTHYIQWNASNISTGIYFVRMVSGEFSQTRKVMMLK